LVFTARCYAEHGNATQVVRPSVTLRYHDHIGWNTSKILLWLISLECSLTADSSATDLLQGDHPEIPGEIGVA